MDFHQSAPFSRDDNRILATDLDGTLIPLEGSNQNVADLQTLQSELTKREGQILFVTGRHLASVLNAMDEHGLPIPQAIVCDVGTSIFRFNEQGKPALVESYAQHLGHIVESMPLADLRQSLGVIEELSLQEDEKQGTFKLSYYVDAGQLATITDQVQQVISRTQAPYDIIHSVDPFNGDGLIDLLPRGVSKAHALAWWVGEHGLAPEHVVFAGDSGNDLAALTAGYRAIVVGNADRAIARQAYEAHQQAGYCGRLFLASATATSGVLEGCRWFGLADPAPPKPDWLGAQPCSHSQTAFRVWAPRHWSVSVECEQAGESQRHQLVREPGSGYHSGIVPEARPGTRYRYRLDDGQAYPDPASARQPEGVHGPSEIVNQQSFAWTDQHWKGVAKRDLLIYELHVGAFTSEGTFAAAIQQLPQLVELGVTAIELMPVAQTPGRWNWGYDGVGLFAPCNTYGQPDDLKALVDACHAHGLAVLLDVVYNHIGPEGNYLPRFGPYNSSKHHTPWGDAFNFDGKRSEPVRQFVIANAIYWLAQFHLDGLRLDAAHFMRDDSELPILAELRNAISRFAESCDRDIHLIAETNSHDPALLAAHESQLAYDAIWVDCVMHCIYSIAAPDLNLVSREYRGSSDLALALQHGFLYEGSQFVRAEHTLVESAERTHIESHITALQTHDAVGNHPHGHRLHQLTSPHFQKAAAALTILHPSIPLLFMGEEFAASTPFPFFADFHDQHLRRSVDQGRQAEYDQHNWHNAPLPSAEQTFWSAKLTHPAKGEPGVLHWYRQLITLRKQGLTEGWLTVHHFKAGYDSELDAYWMRFGRDQHVSIYARLSSDPSGDLVQLPIPGRVILASEESLALKEPVLQLGQNQAVVVSSLDTTLD